MGSIFSAAGQLMSGFSQYSIAKSQQIQLDQNANDAVGASQRQAFLDRLKTQAVQSRATAVAAASGAGATDPSVVNLQGEIGREGEYAALTDLYNGTAQAQQMRYQGAVTRYQGNQAVLASGIDALATLTGGSGGGGQSLFDKFGGGGPNANGDVANMNQSGGLSSFLAAMGG